MAELRLIPEDCRDRTAEVIKIAATGVLLAGAVVAPNLLQLFAKHFDTSKTDKTLRSIRYAKSQGWLTFEDTDQGAKVALTESGRLKWQTLELNQPLKDKKWDKKWRLALFDIPVRKRREADAFRESLRILGFKKLQQSVWIVPYSCQTHISILRQMYNLKGYVRVVEVSSIEGEVELKNTFKL